MRSTLISLAPIRSNPKLFWNAWFLFRTVSPLILDHLGMDFKICSLNVRGLEERLKRRETFNWLRAKKFSIYLLQETYCSENTTATWSSEWGYKTLFSCCSSAGGGVAIFFNFAFQLERSFSDPKGRFIICDIETNGRLFTLATIYAPNDDDPAFFESFFSQFARFSLWRYSIRW